MESSSGKRKKSRLMTGDKSSSDRGNWTHSYGFLICLVIVFFVTGFTVGSLLSGSTEVRQSDSGLFPDYLTRNMLHTVDAKTVSSFVSVKGHHLRPIAPTISEQSLLMETGSVKDPNSPFRVSSIEKEARQKEQHRVVDHALRGASQAQSKPQSTSRIAIDQKVTVSKDRAYSLHCQDEGYMVLPSTAALDHQSVLLAAWIYLDEGESLDRDMRTIFSNKQPGCEASASQNGIALFVNAWQSSDHKVYMEYGGTNSGCNKLDSGVVTLTPKRWYHVAVALTDQISVMFIDGEVVNKQAVTDSHMVSTVDALVGRYSLAAPYPLYGNVSTLAVVQNLVLSLDDLSSLSETVMQLQYVNTAPNVPNLQALYPLEDAAYEKPNTFARDVSKGMQVHVNKAKDGKFIFSSFGGGVAGIKFPLVTGVEEDRIVTDEMRKESDKVAYVRREKIKAGMKHAWKGYKQYAWGNDELKPLSNRGQDNWGGMGVTLVDSLDTLWLMGMKDEFREARDWVARSLTFDRAGQVSVFETTIRELGGLLSAYEFSQDRVFLEKAKHLGDKLIQAFSASPRTGIPSAMLNMRTGTPANGWSGSTAILSELGSLQLEFRYLGYQLGIPSYETTSMKPMQVMARKKPRDGLYPIKVHMDSGDFADSMITFGALGDSFYEYLLKIWIQGGRKETWLRETYDRAMNGAIDRLLQASSPSGLAFFSDWNGHSNYRKMDHLVCFVPGMLALGAYTDPLGLDSGRAQRDLAVAKAMMYTCHEMYHRMKSGISAEYVEFPAGRDLVPGPSVDFYILRPETAESMFILHQLTGDPIYRDWAWEIWEAIELHCKTPSGYASIRNVNSAHSGQDDRMESFFLAETIKYLYLAQDPDRPVDLMEMVFNTEAHPMRLFDPSKHKPIPLD
jgi:mannosyl-oligosaccharide alpha-1,2-mannosidase